MRLGPRSAPPQLLALPARPERSETAQTAIRSEIRQLCAQPGLGSSARQVPGAEPSRLLAQAWGRSHDSTTFPTPTPHRVKWASLWSADYSSGGGAWVCLHTIIGQI